MSYFNDGVEYIIVPDSAITEDMINNTKKAFNSVIDTLRGTLPEVAVAKTVFKVKDPISSAFNGFEWLNHKSVLVVMAGPEWSEAEEL